MPCESSFFHYSAIYVSFKGGRDGQHLKAIKSENKDHPETRQHSCPVKTSENKVACTLGLQLSTKETHSVRVVRSGLVLFFRRL